MSVLHITKENFEAEVLRSDKPVLVDFFADWCMPCKMMAPVLEKAAATFDGRAVMAKVNVDEDPEVAVRFGIQSIPELLLFKDGEMVHGLIGVRPYEELAAAIESVLA